MGIPQVPEQVRRAPLLALRAVFAGIGRVLMAADRPTAIADPEHDVEEVPSRFRSLDQTGNVRLLPAREPARAQDALADLPLPNYDALSLASIRARLRGLDIAKLKVLLDYEAAHAERAEVLGMLERRIEKLKADA